MGAARYVVPLYFFAASVFLGASLVSVALGPLDAVGVPYPTVLRHWHGVVPASCLVLWLALLRWRPAVAGWVAVGACLVGIQAVGWVADGRVVCVPTTRWLEPDERAGFERRAIRVFERSSSGRGHEVVVAPADEEWVRAELERLGVGR